MERRPYEPDWKAIAETNARIQRTANYIQLAVMVVLAIAIITAFPIAIKNIALGIAAAANGALR